MPETLSMASRQINVSPVEYVKNIRRGEHGVMFYTSIEDMRKIHFAFVKSGLENNWGVVYAAPASYSNDLRKGMENYGIDVNKYEEDGSLIIQKGEEIYKDPVKPDLELHKKQANNVINYFVNRGKKGLRIATDLTSFFLPHGLYISLFDVEHLFKPRTDLPLTLLCAYDAADCRDKRRIFINTEISNDRLGRLRYTKVRFHSKDPDNEKRRAIDATNKLIDYYRIITDSYMIHRITEQDVMVLEARQLDPQLPL